jgi:hypothetical protein
MMLSTKIVAQHYNWRVWDNIELQCIIMHGDEKGL